MLFSPFRMESCFFCTISSNFINFIPKLKKKNTLQKQWAKKRNVVKMPEWNGIPFAKSTQHSTYISDFFFLLQRNEYDDNAFVCSQPLDKRNQAKYESNVWIISPQETQYYCVIECNVSSQFGLYCMMVFNLLMYTILIVDIGRSHFDNFPLFQQDNTNSLSLSSFVFVLFHHAVVVLVFFSVLRKLAYFRCRCVSSSFGRLINFEMSSEED